ncbi:MAG: aminotransferase class V-fold PLP-dependent enzyme [Sinimarinibacterium sp.]|jgi:cysteine desulfurase
MIYLDYAATTPLDPAVRAAMLPWLDEVSGFGNPASDHLPGRRARAAVEAARAQVAQLIGAQAEEIVWTSGATESNNLAIKGALEFRGAAGAHIVTSRIEHKSVLDTCRHLESKGVRVGWLGPDRDGRITAEQVLAALRPETVLVSLMWVNNETGTINPVVELAPQLRERGILFHVDAVQAAGKLPVNMADVPIDLLSLTAHKFYGPKGIGALFVRKRPRARLAPQMHGGGHEQGMRSGTLATHQIVGMGAAAALAGERLADERPSGDGARIAVLRDRLWQALGGLPDVLRNGDATRTVPHILNLSFAGVEGESLRARLPGLAISSGSACSAATREPSYVLRALGRDDELAGASLRFSLGRNTTAAEVDAAAAQMIEAVEFLRALSRGDSACIESPRHGRRSAVQDIGDVYPLSVWARFSNPAHGGCLQGAAVRVARATTPASRAEMELSLKPGAPLEARFRAYGCPYTLAVGEWLAEVLERDGLPVLRRIDAAAIRSALEIPEERAHCALMGEDVVHSLLSQIESTS